jgi:hypothetical protein
MSHNARYVKGCDAKPLMTSESSLGFVNFALLSILFLVLGKQIEASFWWMASDGCVAWFARVLNFAFSVCLLFVLDVQK